MITLRRSGERGRTKLDWLDSRHTFSFGEYHDRRTMGFRDLRVINEDRVAPGKGFGTHSHRDMEIITYVLEGSVEHKDSAGIPIEVIVQMEGFQADERVPGNVVQAFNFFVPSSFSFCPGRVKLTAEDPAATRVTNVPVPDPWGPFTGFCAAHRNIDSDPRVWKPVLQYIIKSAGG